MLSGYGAEGKLIIRMQDNAGVIDPRTDNLVNNNAENRFLLTVAINEGLQGEMSLSLSGCSDNGLGDLHVLVHPWFREQNPERVRAVEGVREIWRASSGAAKSHRYGFRSHGTARYARRRRMSIPSIPVH